MYKLKSIRLICGILFLVSLTLMDCKDLLHPEGPAVPDAPEGVTASVLSSSEITLSWNAAPRADSYQVFYGRNATNIDLEGGTTGSKSQTIAELTKDTTYYFTVRAGNRNGWSQPSLPASAIPVEKIYTVTMAGALQHGGISAAPQSGPTGTNITLTISPASGYQLKEGTLKYNDGTDHAISGTSFALPAANVTVSAEFELTPPENYSVTIGSLSHGSISASPQSGPAGTSITLTISPESGYGLKEGTLKYNDGTDHGVSGTGFTLPSANVTVSAEFEFFLDIPGGLNASGAGASSITISWSAVFGATGYKVYRSDTQDGYYGFLNTSGTASYTDTGLPASTTRYYKVSAYNNDGDGGQSQWVSGKTTASGSTPLPPAKPAGFHVSDVQPGSITLSWNSVATAVKYYIYRAAAASSPYIKINETNGTSYTDTVPDDKSYFYTVSGVNSSDGVGSQSSVTFAYAVPHYALPQVGGAALTPIVSGASQYYRLPVTKGSSYTIEWQDGNNKDNYAPGYGSSISLSVTAWQNDGTAIFTNALSGYTNPRTFTASETGYVTIRVVANSYNYDYMIYYR